MKVKEVLKRFKKVFVKRKYKDVLFRFVFRDKKELLQLYNAINETNYDNPEDLTITTMEDVIYVGMKNDLSFIIANDMNLYEHQSTVDENMPLRGFLYFARMYESYIATHNINHHQKTRISLPFPRFIVFYNGEKDIPEVLEMRLSDSFEKKEEKPALECIARFLNINYGHNQALLNSCKRLHDYSYFVDCVRKYLKERLSLKEALECAIDECIQQDILRDVLVKHRTEVEGMFLTTFDKKMYEEAMKMDGRKEEQENTERERQRADKEKERADKLEIENQKLREQLASLENNKV